jgi:Putative zinc-finger
MTQCISEPISWLRLERYGLSELAAAEHSAVDEHLRACPACQACWQSIAGDAQRALPPLAAKARRTPARWTWFGGLVAAAAGVLLMIQLQGPQPEPPRTRTIKGGELRLELVRLGADGRLLDSSRYQADDRFKALINCPGETSVNVELIVYQDGQAFFPLDPIRLESCGNRRSLPGAFELDGTSSALVCVAVGEQPLDRARLARGAGALPEHSVCTAVLPQ